MNTSDHPQTNDADKEPTPSTGEEQISSEESFDHTLRPISLQEYFYGGKVKAGFFDSLHIFLKAAQERKDALDHVLFCGPPGLGKTTLAHILANEMGVQIKVTSGPAIERTGDLASILTNLKEGDILFIDEVHRLNKAVEETLYPAMEDFCLDIVLGKGPSAQTIRLEMPPFTIIGATTRMGLLSAPLRDRFGVTYRVEFFSEEELTPMIMRSTRLLGTAITDDGCFEIARRSRGTPRIANRLIKRIRDFSQVNKASLIDPELVQQALDMLGVDEAGLNKGDRQYLEILVHKFKGGPAGVTTLASAMAEDSGTVEEVIEPFLLQKGYIKKTPQGRVATAKAFEHLGVKLEKDNKLL